MKKYFQAPWNGKDIIISMSLVTVLMILAISASKFFSINELIEQKQNKSLYLLGLLLIQWIIIITPLLFLTLKKYKIKFKDIGFQKIKIIQIIKHVVEGYLLFLAITFIISLLILYGGIKIPGYQIQEKILPLFGNNTVSVIIAGISIILIAPVLEEIFFRGFLLRSLSNKMGLFWGSMISAAAFAILHLQPQNIIPIFILGLIINSLVIKSKSLWPAIVFHTFNNIIAFTIELLILKEIIKIEDLVYI